MAFSLFSLMLKPGQTGTAVWGRGELFPLGVFYAAACKGCLLYTSDAADEL